jgi:N4-gp56 family major capsid protein
MATTSYGTNNPLAVKVWSKRLYREALKATWYSKFMGEGTDSLIQVKTELEKGAGDRITIGLRMQLTGDGVQGDGTLEGNEEALTTYSDNLFIDQLRNAVRSAGKMSEQRIPWSIREEAMAGLRDWWAGRLDTSMANQLAGYILETDTRYTGNQAPIAPDSNHILIQGQATEAALTSTDTFVLSLLDKAVAKAKTLTPMIRPVKVDGDDYYVALLHPFQVYSLRTNTNTGQWLDIQKAAMTGGEVSDNPIFTGALGVYNNVVLHEDSRMPAGINVAGNAAVSNTRRAVFAGAQALSMAFGQKNQDQQATWVEELFDYGNQLGVSAGMIFGLKKTVFNSQDFSTIVLSTYAASPT